MMKLVIGNHLNCKIVPEIRWHMTGVKIVEIVCVGQEGLLIAMLLIEHNEHIKFIGLMRGLEKPVRRSTSPIP